MSESNTKNQIGELTSEELQTLAALQKLQMEFLTTLGQMRIQIKELESKENILIQNIRTEIPKKEEEFKKSLTERLETDKWRVDGDGKIFSE